MATRSGSSASDAIVLQLIQKAISGNPRAWRALLKYQEFANRHSAQIDSKLEFVESDYTRAVAKGSRGVAMTSHEAGYRKPPLSGRFRPGVSGNPKGRPKRKPSPLAERIKTVLNAPVEYRERGRTKVATYLELTLKTVVDRAINGDLGAAEMALKIIARAERGGDSGVEAVLVENWLPDHPGQTADQKTADLAARRDAAPDEWWRSPEE